MPQNPLRALPKSESERLLKLVALEKRLRERGYRNIAGVDEVGRGPLAGPVIAAACLIDEGHFFPGINDSKLLTPNKRKALFQKLTSHLGVCYGIGIVEASVIDRVNILEATRMAMRDAISKLKIRPNHLLVDGLKLIVDGISSTMVIKGDSRCQTIAAASVIAKEVRDEIMVNYHELYPQYGFDQHKGYGTVKHQRALQEYGPCPIHRRTFAPVRHHGNAI